MWRPTPQAVVCCQDVVHASRRPHNRSCTRRIQVHVSINPATVARLHRLLTVHTFHGTPSAVRQHARGSSSSNIILQRSSLA